MEDRKCVVCGEMFTPKSHVQIVCSEACRRQRKLETKRAWAKRQPKREGMRKACAICGKEFSTTHPAQKTCSEECRKKLASIRKMKANKKLKAKLVKETGTRASVCQLCGRTFEYTPSRTGFVPKTCSKECAIALSKKTNRENFEKRITSLEAVASWADITFYPGCRSQYDSSYCPFM